MTVQIIAELGQGFEGCPKQAQLLLSAAAGAGADAAKFQLVYADELAAPDYQHYKLFESLEMPDEAWRGVAALASEIGVELQFDIFGTRSLRMAERIGVSTIKLHPTDVANLGLLREVSNSSASRVLMGAGGTHASEFAEALQVLAGKDVVVLLGFQAYPTADDANQIDRIRQLLDQLRHSYPRVQVGFADHASPESPLRYALAATAIGVGATVLEKHLTLGRSMKLEDHESALNPDEFREFAYVVRTCALALGVASDAEDFGMSDAETAYRETIRRDVVATRSLAVGQLLRTEDLTLKRTSAEGAIRDVRQAYGKTLKRGLQKDEPILPDDLEGDPDA